MNSNKIKTFCVTRLLPASVVAYVSIWTSTTMMTLEMGHTRAMFISMLTILFVPLLLLCLMARRVVSFWTIATVMIGFPFSLLTAVSNAGSFERLDAGLAVWNAATFVVMLLVVGWLIKQAILLDKIAHGSKFQSWIKSLTE